LYRLNRWYTVLDVLTTLNKELVYIVQYTAYFLGVAFFFEVARRAETHTKTVLGATLLFLSVVRSVPFWSPHIMRRLVSKLDSDTKLEVTAAHARGAAKEIEDILKRDLGLRAAAPLAVHLSKLPAPKLYKLLHI